ncbi:hypothetical protein [Ruminococcus sp.]|uniref:hypothetical protein n=1 Tax=Ruminococcus sp. TaxID=41978 RepID=UPI001B000F28|nr:hypothetical protein [Ruminococcus sp.]MBO5559538.1 hypothetical protein [Ruminococcus sp.]
MTKFKNARPTWALPVCPDICRERCFISINAKCAAKVSSNACMEEKPHNKCSPLNRHACAVCQRGNKFYII